MGAADRLPGRRHVLGRRGRGAARARPRLRAGDGADGWWTILLGTGYRATIDALTPDERAHVERRVREAMADGPPMVAPAVLAVARR
jgi:hypothetical protein